MSDWTFVEEIVDQALSLPVEEREHFITEKCEGNEKLKQDIIDFLNSIKESDDMFDNVRSVKKNAFQTVVKKNTNSPISLIGTIIDKYKIIELISHGGMGNVFLAERCDGHYTQTVALKLLRHGMETPENICRFEKEREILAGLNHPNIAKLIDGGVTEFGLPYLVMEYIDGMPIDDYCDENRLTLKERITLFISVCQAVQFAHNNLVIHRDLKPANILVEDNGHIKILDFGIAKLIEDKIETDLHNEVTSQQVLTPGFAAPEQITGESVNTATDTYSLGILLYRILSGCKPFNFNNFSPFERQEIILYHEPRSPSAQFNENLVFDQEKIAQKRGISVSKLFNSLTVDLDAIVLKSIRKEPASRYQTIESLVDDLKRYLSNLPVLAHQGSVSYKVKKVLLRNYKLISAAAVFIIFTVTFSFYHTNRITEERNIAQYETLKTAEISSMLFDLFDAHSPDQALGQPITAEELLQKGLERAKKLDDQPELQAQMYNVIGKVYLKMGSLPTAQRLLNDSVELYTEVLGRNHADTGLAIADQASLYSAFGDYPRAERLFEHALAILDNTSGSQMINFADIISEQAYVLRRQGKYIEAEDAFRKNYDLLKNQLGEQHEKTISAKNSIAVTIFNRGEYEAAEQMLREVLKERQQVLGDTHPDIAESKNSLGALLMNLGQFNEAELLFREAYELRNRILGSDHHKTLLTLNNLGIMQRDQGKFEEADATFQKVTKLKENRFGTFSVSTAISYFSHGELYLMTGDTDKAEITLRKAFVIFDEVLGENHSFYARTKMNLGYNYLLNDQLSKAEEYLMAGYDTVSEIHQKNTLELAIADYQVGSLKVKQGEFRLASRYLNDSLDAFEEIEQTESVRRKIVRDEIQKLNQYASTE
ncbi:serine/threonine-protein kinase [Rhodohalobacter halophilus]|uniref:serine/threonine-protein kinase n=1 Tax=Rhodohalobacter halophilus TaxID=1812810 RepID=UPI00083F9D16|nr:serine/threonine-protein kinase [Rhodohalobacter halophilus]